MSLQKYLQTIKTIGVGNIYVENIRSVYRISTFDARVICEMAVLENVFVKKIGFICPAPECNKRIIAEYNIDEAVPETITCHICEAEERRVYTYATKDLERIEFYRLNNLSE